MEILNILDNENWLDRKSCFLLRSVCWDLRLYFRLDQLCPGQLLFESKRRKIWLYKNTVFKTLDGQLHGKQQTRTDFSTWRYQQEEQIWQRGRIVDDGESWYKNGKRHFTGLVHHGEQPIGTYLNKGCKRYYWIYCQDRIVAFKKATTNCKQGTDVTVLRRKEPKRRNTKEYKRYLNL